jgi:HSP20 family protein
MVMSVFDRLEALRREFIDSEKFLGGMPAAFLPGRAARAYPLVNVFEDGDNFYVEALTPGVARDQLEVTTTGSVLTLAGRKPPLEGVQPERMHRNERAAGSFMRTVTLPADIEPDRVSAEFSRGLLLVTLPRSESNKPRRIQVRSEQSGRENGHAS